MTGDVVENSMKTLRVKALRTLVEHDRCSAVVVAGQATIRNPVLADRVAADGDRPFDVPVICDTRSPAPELDQPGTDSQSRTRV